MTQPPPNVLQLPLEQRVAMALQAAVEKVVIEQARHNRPLYVWQNGKVAEISAKALQAEAGRLRST